VLVPPEDRRLQNFRAITGRSTFVSVGEVGQLSYDRPRYLEAWARLALAGVTVPARLHVDGSGYHRLTREQLVVLRDQHGVDFAILETAARAAPLPAPCTAERDGYCVVELARLP
jgi:hypothetical protein